MTDEAVSVCKGEIQGHIGTVSFKAARMLRRSLEEL